MKTEQTNKNMMPEKTLHCSLYIMKQTDYLKSVLITKPPIKMTHMEIHILHVNTLYKAITKETTYCINQFPM